MKRIGLSTLVKQRKKLNITQSEIADLLGVSRSSYIRFESGGGKLSVDMFLKLIELLDLSVCYRTDLDIDPQGKVYKQMLDEAKQQVEQLDEQIVLLNKSKSRFDNRIDNLKKEIDLWKSRYEKIEYLFEKVNKISSNEYIKKRVYGKDPEQIN